ATLEIISAVTLNGNVTSIGSQLYKGEVTLNAASALRANGISFRGAVIGSLQSLTLSTTGIIIESASAAAITVDTLIIEQGGGFSHLEGKVTANNFTLDAGFLQVDEIEIAGSLTNKGILVIGEARFVGDTDIRGNIKYTDFICTTVGVTLSFAVNSTQTIDGSFTIRGAAGSEIVLRLLSGTGRWKINPSASSVEYANVSSSTNENAFAINALFSINSGDNTNWFFIGSVHTWAGGHPGNPSDWHTKQNWNPPAVPDFGASVIIPDGLTDYPILNADVNIFYDDGATGSGSIVINKNATMNANGYNITAKSTTNAGSVFLKGNEVISATKINESASTIIYSGTVSDIAVVWGSSYENLIFTQDGSVDSSDDINIAGTTTIDTTDDVKLQGQNIFTGLVTITNGKSLILNSSGEFTIEADANCESLEIGSDVILNGNVVTTGKQEYKGEVSLVADESTLKGGDLWFKGSLQGSGKILILEVTAGQISSAEVIAIETLKVSILGLRSSFFTTVKLHNFIIEQADHLAIDNLEISGNLINKGTLTPSAIPGKPATWDGALCVIDEVVFLNAGVETNITGNFTFKNFNCKTAGKTILFQAGSTQAILESLSLAGQTGNNITLKSSNESSAYLDRRWFIDSKDKRSVQFATVKDSVNLNDVPIATTDSIDLGYNTNWWFFSTEYTWVGQVSTSWSGELENWSPASEQGPGKNAIVIIPNEFNGTAITQYPVLTKAVDLGDSGEIKITATSDYTHLDGAGFDITVGKIVNEGKIRLQGTEKITGTKENKAGSVIEYYGSLLAINDSWGSSYENLVFAETAAVDSTDIISVAGTTTINTTGDIKLYGQNIFTGLVTITRGKIVIVNSGGEFTIEADANCGTLEIGSDVILNGNVVTTSRQDYMGAVSLVADETRLKGVGISFEGLLQGSGKTLVLESTAPIMGRNAALMNLDTLRIEKTGAGSVIEGKVTVSNFTLGEGSLTIE
ncbi:MAG: hypothetical protein ACRC5H_00015, partial [Treponemataceae bacterium]